MRTHAAQARGAAVPAAAVDAAVPFIGQRASIRQVLRAPRPAADLEVGPPDDVYEREAERVADEVMRGGAAGEEPPPARAGVLQRCSCGGGEGECAACREKRLRRFKNGAAGGLAEGVGGAGGAVPPSVREVLRSPGRPLDPGVRAFMEPRFGRDFGAVRVHDDAQAAASAAAVDALAYTVGENVVFAAGRYAPAEPAGRRLLAHELAHTVQQSGAPGLTPMSPMPPMSYRVAQRQPAPPSNAAAAAPSPTPSATSSFVECAGALADGFTVLGRVISGAVDRLLGQPAPAPGSLGAGITPLETRVQRAVGKKDFEDAFCMLDMLPMNGLLPTLASLTPERPLLRSNLSTSKQQGRIGLALDAADGVLAKGGTAICTNSSFAALNQGDREALYDFLFPQGIPSPAGTFFGQTIPGVTAGLRTLLERAQTIAKRSLCLNAHDPSWQAREPIFGSRPGSTGFHGRNMAIDLEYNANPYIMHEKDEAGRDAQLRPVYQRIAGLIRMQRSIIPEDLTTVQRLSGTDRTWKPNGAKSPIPITTGELHDLLKIESDAMVRYFDLLRPAPTPATPAAPGAAPATPNTTSPVTLEDFLARLQATPAIQKQTGLTATTTAAQLRAKIASDYLLVGGSAPQLQDLSGQTPSALSAATPPGVAPGDKATSDPPFVGGMQAGATTPQGTPAPASFRRPELGFLSIPREVAEALTAVGLRWGAIDFGGASGDVQHFDCGFSPGGCP